MATTVSTTIPADNSSLGYWEKTVTDVNNVDESFANARDLGYTRLNYARVSVVGKLSEYYDSSDMYKIQLQSNGTVSLSIKGGDSSNEKVLDLSAYEQKLDELKNYRSGRLGQGAGGKGACRAEQGLDGRVGSRSQGRGLYHQQKRQGNAHRRQFGREGHRNPR